MPWFAISAGAVSRVQVASECCPAKVWLPAVAPVAFRKLRPSVEVDGSVVTVVVASAVRVVVADLNDGTNGLVDSLGSTVSRGGYAIEQRSIQKNDLGRDYR